MLFHSHFLLSSLFSDTSDYPHFTGKDTKVQTTLDLPNLLEKETFEMYLD